MQPRWAWVLATTAIVCGMPLYLALGHAGLLPITLRDRPWPLEAVSFVMGAA
jgi:hypothetical protein